VNHRDHWRYWWGITRPRVNTRRTKREQEREREREEANRYLTIPLQESAQIQAHRCQVDTDWHLDWWERLMDTARISPESIRRVFKSERGEQWSLTARLIALPNTASLQMNRSDRTTTFQTRFKCARSTGRLRRVLGCCVGFNGTSLAAAANTAET